MDSDSPGNMFISARYGESFSQDLLLSGCCKCVAVGVGQGLGFRVS